MNNKQSSDRLSHYAKSRIFEKFDVIIAIILVAAIALSLYFVFATKSGSTVEVYYKGELIESRSLYVDAEFTVEKEGKNTIKISNGSVSVTYSDCKNHLCSESAPICKAGERIVCAPNGIVIVITGGELDGITGRGE